MQLECVERERRDVLELIYEYVNNVSDIHRLDLRVVVPVALEHTQ